MIPRIVLLCCFLTLLAVPAYATIGIDQWRYIDAVERDLDNANAIIYRNDITDPSWAARAEFAVAKWNTLQCLDSTCSGVRIRPATPDETPTLVFNEDPTLSCQQAGGIAGYLGRNNDWDLITLWPNVANCSNLTEIEKKEVFIHELGHALGAEHQPGAVLPREKKHKKKHKGKHHKKHKHHKQRPTLVTGTTQMLDGTFLGTDELGTIDITNHYTLWHLCQGDYVCANQVYGLVTPECADKNVALNDDVGCE